MTQPMTPLRQRMLDDMKIRNMAAGTRKTYVRLNPFMSSLPMAPSNLLLRLLQSELLLPFLVARRSQRSYSPTA
jgi:hypothetical protein